MLERELTNANAWRGAELATDAGYFELPALVTAEFIDAAAELVANPLPLAALKPDHIDMPATRAFLAKVKTTLTDGIRFALIKRLPLEAVGEGGA